MDIVKDQEAKRHWVKLIIKELKNNGSQHSLQSLDNIWWTLRMDKLNYLQSIRDFSNNHNVHPEMEKSFTNWVMANPKNGCKIIEYEKDGQKICYFNLLPGKKVNISELLRMSNVSKETEKALYTLKDDKPGNSNIGNGELEVSVILENGFLLDTKGDVGIRIDASKPREHGNVIVIEVKAGKNAKIGSKKNQTSEVAERISEWMRRNNQPDQKSYSFHKLDPKNKKGLTLTKDFFNKTPLEQAERFNELLYYYTSYSINKTERMLVNPEWLNIGNKNNRGTIFINHECFEKFLRSFVGYSFRSYRNGDKNDLSLSGKYYDALIYIGEEDDDRKLVLIHDEDDEDDEAFGKRLMDIFKFKYPSFRLTATDQCRDNLLGIERFK